MRVGDGGSLHSLPLGTADEEQLIMDRGHAESALDRDDARREDEPVYQDQPKECP
jgi:hypothetical protein